MFVCSTIVVVKLNYWNIFFGSHIQSWGETIVPEDTRFMTISFLTLIQLHVGICNLCRSMMIQKILSYHTTIDQFG